MKTRTNQPVTTFDIEDLEVTHELKAFENIVDKDGHKRFIEGDITIETISGVTQTYGKWSLSGSHLLIVVGLDVANTTALVNNTKLAIINIPDWIKEKIVGLWSSIYVDNRTITLMSDTWTQQSCNFNVQKLTNNNLQIRIGSNLTLTDNRHCRVAFDLLIDNE